MKSFGALVCALSICACSGAKSGLLLPEVEADAAVDAQSDVVIPPPPDASPPAADFSFLEPYLGSPTPSRRVITLASTSIQQVDVAFSVDTTGSMGSSIANLISGLSTTVMPELQKAIPSVGLAVVDHKDSQSSDPWTVKLLQTITSDVTLAQSAVKRMSASGGGDEPEGQEESMLHVLTGEPIPSTPPVSKHVAAPGTFGGVDFRPGALPVVVEITDAHWHDAVKLPWASTALGDNVTLDKLAAAFRAVHARFVGVTDVHYLSAETTPFPLLTQPNELSDATLSSVPAAAFSSECGAGMCCTGVSGAALPPDAPGGGCRLNFQVKDGVGMTVSLVHAIQAISLGSEFDVIAVASNDPTNAPSDGGTTVDATKFIKTLRAMEEGETATGCVAHPAKDTDGDGVKDTFVAVLVGTHVCFEVIPRVNDSVKPKAFDQTFHAYVNVLGLPGSVKLDQRRVAFVVPAATGV